MGPIALRNDSNSRLTIVGWLELLRMIWSFLLRCWCHDHQKHLILKPYGEYFFRIVSEKSWKCKQQGSHRLARLLLQLLKPLKSSLFLQHRQEKELSVKMFVCFPHASFHVSYLAVHGIANEGVAPCQWIAALKRNQNTNSSSSHNHVKANGGTTTEGQIETIIHVTCCDDVLVWDYLF